MSKKEIPVKKLKSIIEKSNLFDKIYYLRTYPDARRANDTPLDHFIKVGLKEDRKPNEDFDPVWYREYYIDVKEDGAFPFIHYLIFGIKENRFGNKQEHLLYEELVRKNFDIEFYKNYHKDLSQESMDFDSILHYVRFGKNEKRKIKFLILEKDSEKREISNEKSNRYKKIQKENIFLKKELQKLVNFKNYYYIHKKYKKENKKLSILTEKFLYEFNENAYLAHNIDVKNAVEEKKISSGLEHLIFYGWDEVLSGKRRLYRHSILFNEEEYLKNRNDIKKAISEKKIYSALQHFIMYAQKETKQKTAVKKKTYFLGDKQMEPQRRTVIICAHIIGKTLFGSERSLLDMLEGAAASSNVILLVPTINDEYYNHVKKWIAKLYVVPYGWWRDGSSINYKLIDRIEKIIIDNSVNFVHVNTIMLREALIAGRNTGASTITHIRELITGDLKLSEVIGESVEDIIKEVVNRSDYFIGNSEATLDAYSLKNDEKSYLLYNTVDCNQFVHKDLEERISVGIVSSNIPKKGIFDFVEVAKLCMNQTNLCFKLFGPENEYTKEIADMNIGNIEICGYKNSPQEAMDEIDIILSLSNFTESFGRTIAEGMASSKPVIAYRWGAPPELIDDNETGFLVAYKDTKKVAEILIKFAKNPDQVKEMGEKGRLAALARFDISKYKQQMTKIYDDIMIKEKKNKINIAYFLWHFPVPSETFVLNELRKLIQQNYDVKVYCKQSPYKDFKPDFNIKWQRITSIENFAETLINDNREIVHSHFVYPTVTDMVWPACEKANIPFTFIAHAQDIFRYSNEEKNKIDEISKSDKCYKVFVPSKFHFEYLKERGVLADKMVITPNTVDPDLYLEGLTTSHIKRTNRSICAIHRFTEKKGLSNLIKSAKLIDNDITINIYGYGDLKKEYEKIISENNINNVFIKDGVKGREAMLEVYAQHDLFACPSVRAIDGDMDGIPTVLMEAMSSGIPVITTDISGIPDLVKDELTGIVTKSTPENIAEDINRFYAISDTKVEAIVNNARELVENKFNTRYATENLLRVWEQKTIDLIIVSWNNLLELKEVCRRLLKYTSLPFHLIIVDNQSKSDVIQYLEELNDTHENVTVIFNESNDMVGPGTNKALEYGTSDYAIYVCGKEGFVFNYGWEIPLVKYMKHHPRVGQAGTLGYSPTYMYGKEYPTGIALFDKFRNKDFAEKNPDRIFKHVQGGFFIMRREMYEDIGGFSYEVPHNYTDVEYSYYVESCGWELGQIPEMLALFNKTRPGLFARLDETMSAIHPPMMEDIPYIEKIMDKKVDLCNICEWKEGLFLEKDGQKICPNCASTNVDRTVFRYLAESEYTHRRVPALGIGMGESLKSFWKQQFQGRMLVLKELMNEIRKNKKIENADAKTYIIYMKYDSSLSKDEWNTLMNEYHRLLHREGEVIIHLTDECNTSLLEEIIIDATKKLNLVKKVRFKSEICYYDWNKMLIFKKENV